MQLYSHPLPYPVAGMDAGDNVMGTTNTWTDADVEVSYEASSIKHDLMSNEL